MSEEKKAYDKGYSAGRRRAKTINEARARAAKQDAFWQRSMLQIMNSCASQNGWKRGDTPITTVKDRMRLAAEFADAALSAAMDRGRV